VQTRIIATYAPEPIQAPILPVVCSGECLLAICMTESDAGTDVANYKTNVAIRGRFFTAEVSLQQPSPRLFRRLPGVENRPTSAERRRYCRRRQS
jgi:hypothetical protein